MSLAGEVAALRSSAGLSRSAHVALVHVDGPDALDFLQAMSTQSPYAREGRVRHALFLRDDATVFADVLIVKVEDGFFVLGEGPTEAEIIAWLARAKGDKHVGIRGLSDDWAIVGVDGPYAWEVAAGVLGPIVLGMPYLTLIRKDDVLCLRAGKTGEYGYFLIVPRASVDAVEARLREVGAPLDLAPVGLEALDVCALESWHFSMRNLGETALVLTPIELQLQWRVVYSREFMGAAALRERRAKGAKVRVTCFTSDQNIAPGERVLLAGADVGEVLAARSSPTLHVNVGSLLLERRVAHPHLSLSTTDGRALRTQTASLVHNRSLFIQPHKHSYATRNAVVT